MGAKFDVIVIGAGIAGLGASIALSEKGHKVTVLERHSQLQTQGGVIQIGPSGARIFDQYRILEDVIRQCGDSNIKAIYQRRWADGSELISATAESTEKAFGYDACWGWRSDFQLVLFEVAKKRGVSVRFGCVVTKVDEEQPAVTLQDGEAVKADLIVAADGINSATRLAFNPGKRQLFSGMDDHIMSIPMSALENNPKLAPFRDSLNFWLGPGGCVVSGPANTKDGPHLYLEFIVLGENKGREGHWQKDVDLDHVRNYFSTWDPVLAEMLAFADAAFIWRLAYTEPGLEWTSKSGKVVLVGDAAHAVLPHSGAGALTGIEDGASLAECVTRASATSDLPRCLQAFEKIRKPRISYLQNAGIFKAQAWLLPDGPEQEARDQRLREMKTLVPPLWDKVHIDDPPDVRQFDLMMPYVAGHRTVEFTNRKLDELFN